MSRATINPVGPKAMHPLIKLQKYDGTESLDTFLMKFQYMASYLQWDDENMFHHLCTRLEGAVGQVIWDSFPRATMADIVCHLQSRFGTQLLAERFKAELRAWRRAPGKSFQQLYQDICRLVTLAYCSGYANPERR